MNPLPPQAYTKETLLKAYSWLQNQQNNIKEMATTPDVLVSLYLKATRDGDAALDRPSIQNFKNELKQLAGLMGELESPSPTGTATATATAASATSSRSQNSNDSQGLSQGNGNSATGQSGASALPPHSMANSPSLAMQNSSTAASIFTNTGYQVHLDAKSWFMIQEVKDALNLSSELEALRVLIKIGYTKVNGI